jgi:methionyl-tRNA formyltransferase
VAGDDSVPGTVVEAGKQGIDVACGSGRLRLLQIQLPGGKRMKSNEFINARQVLGVVLGSPDV